MHNLTLYTHGIRECDSRIELTVLRIIVRFAGIRMIIASGVRTHDPCCRQIMPIVV